MGRRRATDPETIIQAALRCFAEKGYEATRTASIAREAGISEGTLYNYFRDKRSLFLAVVDWINQKIDEEFLHSTGDDEDPVAFFLGEAVRIARFVDGNRDFLEVLIRDLYHRDANEIAAQFMDQNHGRERAGLAVLLASFGYAPEDLEYRTLELAFHGGLDQIFRRWCVGGCREPVEPQLTDFFQGYVNLLRKATQEVES